MHKSDQKKYNNCILFAGTGPYYWTVLTFTCVFLSKNKEKEITVCYHSQLSIKYI